jgi:S1-C subfamily serine protease
MDEPTQPTNGWQAPNLITLPPPGTDPTATMEQPTVERPGAAPPATPPKKRPGRAGGGRVIGITIMAAALAIASFMVGRVTNTATATTVAGVTTTSIAGATTPTVGDAVEPVAAVAAALEPAVVQIDTPQGLGSGVIYDSSGLILTAAHVVEGNNQVLVQLSNGNKVQGTVVGSDTNADVAVVKIDAPNLTAAVLATDEQLQTGQIAVAIGSPFGLEQSVTAGVVSSVNRPITGPDGAVRQMIQTDAPINPGNSGGALADREGRVIGINDQIFSQSGGNEGLGFAIPITTAKQVADKLVAGTPITQPVLGVQGTDPQLGQAGGVITTVQPNSAAAAAGLRAGDLVTAVDNTQVTSFEDLAGIIKSHQPGDVVVLTVHRGDQNLQIQVTLGS